MLYQWDRLTREAPTEDEIISWEQKWHYNIEDQNTGIAAALRAMEGPLRQIVDNAGDEASVVLDKVRQGEGNFGYNAATGEYGDMIGMGILDPAKVTRTALQAAGSVAGLMITTEVMIAEAPKEEAAPAMPDMGGMGGMGGMM